MRPQFGLLWRIEQDYFLKISFKRNQPYMLSKPYTLPVIHSHSPSPAIYCHSPSPAYTVTLPTQPILSLSQPSHILSLFQWYTLPAICFHFPGCTLPAQLYTRHTLSQPYTFTFPAVHSPSPTIYSHSPSHTLSQPYTLPAIHSLSTSCTLSQPSHKLWIFRLFGLTITRKPERFFLKIRYRMYFWKSI